MASHSKSSFKPACRGICTAVALLLACGTLIGKPGDAFLKTKVDPGRAGVFLDGKYLGPAANFKIARKYGLAPGKHEVKLLDPRYEEFTTTVDITAGKTVVVAQTLKPLPPPKKPLGTLKTTFIVWIVIDPLVGVIEMLLPESREHRAERLAEKADRSGFR